MAGYQTVLQAIQTKYLFEPKKSEYLLMWDWCLGIIDYLEISDGKLYGLFLGIIYVLFFGKIHH